jgi:hypothetical protein
MSTANRGMWENREKGYTLGTLTFFLTGLNSPLMLQEVEAPTISRQSAHEDGKAVCQPYAPAALTPSFMLEAG